MYRASVATMSRKSRLSLAYREFIETGDRADVDSAG
jgi:hypothetical protein